MSARAAATMLAGLALAMTACEGRDLGFPWDFERMLNQPKLLAYEASGFFRDGKAMQTPPPGTVPYRPPGAEAPGALRPLAAAPGGIEDARARLEHGRERFEIYCAPCHGIDGYASTPVAAAMALRPPPSLHEPRLRALSTARIAQVVRAGYGLMPSYASLLSAQERRDVVAYVRVLQRSQHARLGDLPPDLRREAERALPDVTPGHAEEGS